MSTSTILRPLGLSRAVLALLLTSFSQTAEAVTVVDDFEKKSFSFSCNYLTGTLNMALQVNEPAHCVSMFRELYLEPLTGGTVSASLQAGVLANDKMTVQTNNGGYVSLIYEPATPVDLIEGGNVDRLVVKLDQTQFGGRVDLNIYGGNNEIYYQGLEVDSNTLTFDLPQEESLLSSVTEISVTFNGLGGDRIFVVSDIRTKRVTSHYAQFLGEFVATHTPPIPTPPLMVSAFDPQFQPLFQTEMSVLQLDNNGGIPATTLQWRSTPFDGGMQGFTELWWNDWAAPDNTLFEISVGFTGWNGLTPEILYPPDPIIGAQAFGTSVDLVFRDDQGVAVATSLVQIGMTTGRYAELEFSQVTITLHGNDEIRLGFVLNGWNWEPELPILESWALADWSTEVTTDVAEMVVARSEPIRLLAAPSVMRRRTAIRANRPLTLVGEVGLFDVDGRRVRRLELAAGEASVAWDGRDEAGKDVPTGVYWARLENDATAGTTRIVRIR